MTTSLTILFTGICDFVGQTGGKILVALPDARQPLVPDQEQHRAFLQWKRQDMDSERTTVKADPQESDSTSGVLILNGNELSINGPLAAEPLFVEESFVRYIPSMKELGHSTLHSTSTGVAARILLDGGRLSADTVERGIKWVFKPVGDTKLDDAERQAGREFYNRVYLRRGVDASSKSSVRIVTGVGDLVIPAAKTDVEIIIGNLEGKLTLTGEEHDQLPQDVDFAYHYEMSSKRLPVEKRLVPTREPKKPRGRRVACYAAYWGDIKPGVQ
jgi:hypothetical protein